MNIKTIKKNMKIKPIDLFKEDILSLNKNIPELIESILKVNRISFMAKYKNILYRLN